MMMDVDCAFEGICRAIVEGLGYKKEGENEDDAAHDAKNTIPPPPAQ